MSYNFLAMFRQSTFSRLIMAGLDWSVQQGSEGLLPLPHYFNYETEKGQSNH